MTNAELVVAVRAAVAAATVEDFPMGSFDDGISLLERAQAARRELERQAPGWAAELADRLHAAETEVARLKGLIVDRWAEVNGAALDLELLSKLASGEGGRRTGALRRAGYLEWTVTPRGLAALLAATGATLDEGGGS